MKVSEILNEGPIYDTPEYDLSSSKDKGIAFTAQLPYKEFRELVKELNVEVPTHISIKLADGSEHSLKVELSSEAGRSLQPADGSYKKKIYKGGRNFYIIDGPLNMGPKTKFFNDSSFYNSPDYKEFYQNYSDAMKKRREEFDKKLQIDLREKLPAAAKKALADDLLGMIKDGKSEAVRKWFADAGFKMTNGADLPPAAEFKKMNSLKGWTISTKQFGGPNRGVDGVSIDIDWDKKTFGHLGWSSSD